MDGIYKNIEKYNPNKKRKTIVFDEMIDACLVIKNLIVTELFIRDRKLNLSFVFIPILFYQKILHKFYALFYDENSKQTRTSTNCI